MKKIFTFLFLLFLSGTYAQSLNCFPDSMQEISISGTVLLDTTFAHTQYYLDADNDLIADYKLNFGPYWYEPDSAGAVRPLDGDVVDIFGSVHIQLADSMLVIVVYEINDTFWRDPYTPNWNPVLKQAKKHQRTFRNHQGFASGWYADSLEITDLQGYVLIDSTCYYWHYYIDVNGDTLPDYALNFGPPWYENPNGIQKPQDGDFVTVSGLLFDTKLMVLTLNDVVWYEPFTVDNPLAAKWINRNMYQNKFIYTPFDTLSNMMIRTGWHNQLPDSLYCQMLRLFPQNVPFAEKEHVFAGYEIGIFNRNRQNLMISNDSIGGKIQLASKARFRFHFENAFKDSAQANKYEIKCKVYNRSNGTWEIVNDAQVDYSSNLVIYESETINSLIILTFEPLMTAISESTILPDKAVLAQNYPNPFNPLTIIEFYLPQQGNISLKIYNILGQHVAGLVDNDMNSGLHRFIFDAHNYSSGTYFYELKKDGVTIDIKKMNLIK